MSNQRRIITRKPKETLLLPSQNESPSEPNPSSSTNQTQTKTVMSRKPTNIILRDFSSDYNIARHVSSDFIVDCLIDKSAVRLIKAIYCDQNVPHNHCVRCIAGQFQVYTKNHWTSVKAPNDLARELIQTVYRIMRNHFNKYPNTVIEKFHTRNNEPNMYSIETWLEDLWDDALDNSNTHNSSILSLFRN